jgi:hypothetical protein
VPGVLAFQVGHHWPHVDEPLISVSATKRTPRVAGSRPLSVLVPPKDHRYGFSHVITRLSWACIFGDVQSRAGHTCRS